MTEKVLYVRTTPIDQYGDFVQFLILKRKNRYVLEVMDVSTDNGLHIWQHIYTYISAYQKNKIMRALSEGRFEYVFEELNQKEFYVL